MVQKQLLCDEQDLKNMQDVPQQQQYLYPNFIPKAAAVPEKFVLKNCFYLIALKLVLIIK